MIDVSLGDARKSLSFLGGGALRVWEDTERRKEDLRPVVKMGMTICLNRCERGAMEGQIRCRRRLVAAFVYGG
jgi:hypothetical protein